MQQRSFESRAYELVGRLVMVFSRLDVNLALYVASYRGQEHYGKVLTDLDNTSFKHKLSLIAPAIERRYPNDRACKEAWAAWEESADALRCLRNDLIHGRWGIAESRGFVANVVGLPGLATQHENQYTLAELQDEVERAEAVSAALWPLMNKWPT